MKVKLEQALGALDSFEADARRIVAAAVADAAAEAYLLGKRDGWQEGWDACAIRHIAVDGHEYPCRNPYR